MGDDGKTAVYIHHFDLDHVSLNADGSVGVGGWPVGHRSTAVLRAQRDALLRALRDLLGVLHVTAEYDGGYDGEPECSECGVEPPGPHDADCRRGAAFAAARAAVAPCSESG